MSTAGAIIEESTADGVRLTPLPSGTINVLGVSAAVERWLPIIRQCKSEILAELHERARLNKVLSMLQGNPGIRYAVEVADADAAPVLVTVAIRDIAAFELAIPHVFFDSFVLLDLIEKHTGGRNART